MSEYENAIQFLEMESESYTYVISETLQLAFPGGAPPRDTVVRDRPSEPLLERTPEEVAKLQDHPLFTGH